MTRIISNDRVDKKSKRRRCMTPSSYASCYNVSDYASKDLENLTKSILFAALDKKPSDV